MNVIEYKSLRTDIVFCCVDNIHLCKSAWVAELTKNIADYTVSNIVSKKFSVYVGLDEDRLLTHVTNLNYKYAVVFSTGTEFINGRSFFKSVEELTTQDFFVAGHILDRGDAYYELHHQCFIINLEIYKNLKYPSIGKQELGACHTKFKPNRSFENFHDSYTPVYVSAGNIKQEYTHKAHGWNILTHAWNNNYPTLVFNETLRNNKKYYYPENLKDFNKLVSWAYSRESYCKQELVNKQHTDVIEIPDYDFEFVITPASGTWYIDYISKTKSVTILIYDYNQQALDCWKQNEPKLDNVTYEYVKIDLLEQYDVNQLIRETNCKTIINLSNIFCFEGTSTFRTVAYRLYKENQLIKQIPKNWFILFSERSSMGFANPPLYGQSLEEIQLSELIKPTWHVNSDWIDN
jgi:hypothetical protein